LTLDQLEFDCPWCGQTNHLELEPGDIGHWVIQDCQVCCRPIELLHRPEGNGLEVRREGE